MSADPLLSPLRLGPNLTLKNPILRSSVTGRFDNEDGSLTQTRINWETKFAKGGVGAIISAFAPVTMEGRIIPGVATIDRDDVIPLWAALGDAVHAYDCKYLVQLSHAGRQRDIPGVHNARNLAPSATNTREIIHGFRCRAMTPDEIADVVQAFAKAAWRAREAGLDGVELHAGHGYLFSQFLSSGINTRKDHYGGALENRARFLLEVIRAIRAEVGRDFHLQVKLSAVDRNNVDPTPIHKKGNTLQDTLEIAKWCEAAGADAIHVSTGSLFPHPLNPAGGLPLEEIAKTYDALVSSGDLTLRNYLAIRMRWFHPVIRWIWHRQSKGLPVEGVNVADARAIKAAVSIPVVVTGGFQSASAVREVLSGPGALDGVTITRALMANPDLLQQWLSGKDRPERPCTYCNKCIAHLVKDPLGCYDETRYPSYDAMIEEIMSVYTPRPELVVPSRRKAVAAE
jgi:2,4-dienoyl-CoA reductase-like NADH-dependent reductase (Old Yellow Enzyme family)